MLKGKISRFGCSFVIFEFVVDLYGSHILSQMREPLVIFSTGLKEARMEEFDNIKQETIAIALRDKETRSPTLSLLPIYL